MYNFISELAIIQVPRAGNAKKHKLSDILFIAIAAGVADCNTSRLRKVIMGLLLKHMKKTGESKSFARMRKQDAWNTKVLEEYLFQVFSLEKEENACQ